MLAGRLQHLFRNQRPTMQDKSETQQLTNNGRQQQGAGGGGGGGRRGPPPGSRHPRNQQQQPRPQKKPPFYQRITSRFRRVPAGNGNRRNGRATGGQDQANGQANLDSITSSVEEGGFFITNKCKPRHTHCVYETSATIAMVAMVSLTATCIVLVTPYRQAQAFHEANCTVLNVERFGNRSCSSYGGSVNRGSALYPCVKVFVSYLDILDRRIEGTMYETQYLFRDRKCTYKPPCSTNEKIAISAVEDFLLSYGVKGKTFPCWYDIGYVKNIVIHVEGRDLWKVLVGTLIPAVVFVVCITVMVVLHCLSGTSGWMERFAASKEETVKNKWADEV